MKHPNSPKSDLLDPSPSLAELIQLAEAGDTLAAREVADELALCCAEAASRSVPLPKKAASYLFTALRKIAAGSDANIAFHMKKRGREKEWSLLSKRLAVGLVEQLLAKGFKHEDALEEAASVIQRRTSQLQRPHDSSPWSQFVGKTVSSETINSWYYELRPK